MNKFKIISYVFLGITLTVIGTFLSLRGVTYHVENIIPNEDTSYKPTSSETFQFDTIVSINLGEKIYFKDGLNILLNKIDDSRCKLDVECFWQGELSMEFIMANKDSPTITNQFRISTVSKPTFTFSGYKFTLEDATDKSARITISQVLKK